MHTIYVENYVSARLVNNILWDNSASYGSEIYVSDNSGASSVMYSDIKGGWTGAGNIDADPLFVDAANGDFHLMIGSPAIDSGTNEYCAENDFDGVKRPQDGDNNGSYICDMGVFEVPGMNPPSTAPIAKINLPDDNFNIIHEGQVLGLNADPSYDPDGDSLLYDWDLDNDGEFDDATGVTAEITFADNGVYTVGLRVTDTGGLSDTTTTTVHVDNVAPQIQSVTGPLDAVPVGAAATIEAAFTDPSADTWAVTMEWGDSTTSMGIASDYIASGSHVYTAPGVYTVSVTVTDDDGGSTTTSYQYVVVYDPNGGFVSGNGTILSPAGAYTPDPTLTGKAVFGFVSKYKKGANLPEGDTMFQFKVAELKFKSTAHDWLVVAGNKAKFKGTGTINGEGEYGFMLTAVDGAPDMFRIKIWDKVTGEVIYDNQMGASDDGDAATALESGSIVIHK